MALLRLFFAQRIVYAHKNLGSYYFSDCFGAQTIVQLGTSLNDLLPFTFPQLSYLNEYRT
jgi:hypothetical protein